MAERLRSAVHDLGLPHPGLGPQRCVTVSIGACASPAAQSIASTIACADAALYSAKQAGRNRIAA